MIVKIEYVCIHLNIFINTVIFVLLYIGFNWIKDEYAFVHASFLSVLFWILSGFIVALIFALLTYN